jgi:hypothetical protein
MVFTKEKMNGKDGHIFSEKRTNLLRLRIHFIQLIDLQIVISNQNKIY